MLHEQIKQQTLAARLEHRNQPNPIRVNLMTTLLSEMDAVAKKAKQPHAPDPECVAVVKKFVKNNNELRSADPTNAIALAELAILNEFLPKQLTEDELRTRIEEAIVEVGPKKGLVMRVLATKYGGMYDGATAATLVSVMTAG